MELVCATGGRAPRAAARAAVKAAVKAATRVEAGAADEVGAGD